MLYCYDSNIQLVGTFESQVEASKQTQIPRTSIQYSLYNNQPLQNGFLFTDYEISKPEPYAKVLLLDIETSPLQAYVWQRWKQNIHSEQMISEWFMISWSAKWLYKPDTLSDVLTPDEAINEDDSRIIESLWKLLDEASIIIAHNGDRFDIPKINSRFIFHGLVPPSPYRSIDTCNVAKKHFGFSSNKLDELCKHFGMGQKINTSFSLWSDCLKGDQKALKEMETYNRKDVVLLEELYVKLRPWIRSHPNIGIYMDGNKQRCCNCGSDKLIKNGYYYTNVAKYQALRCKDCGAPARDRTNLLTKAEKEKLKVPTAR